MIENCTNRKPGTNHVRFDRVVNTNFVQMVQPLRNVFTGETKRRLSKERSKLYGMRAAALSMMAARFSTSKNKDDPEFVKYQTAFHELETEIQKVESKLLRMEAYYLGIEYPTKEEKPDWWISDETESWLSEKGLIRLNNLVKAERRKNIEWWVKIVTPLIGSLISLLGLIIALITILRNTNR